MNCAFCGIWLVLLSYVFTQEPVVNIPQGRIVGIRTYMKNTIVPIEIFYGVPYATPPVGRYRFSAPERHAGWRRTFFAHRLPPKCPDGDSDYFDEDCLFLNIWTPRRADEILRPVVVVLYSESWTKSGPSLPCQELAAEGVVVVTVAYRLHILSFFTLKNIASRGNLALLDQYLAMLWVRENIAAFGGDPASITLLGIFAGADSVLEHIASPRSIGLFQRAIVMSPLDIWKTIDKDKDINASEVCSISREIARSLGCNGSEQEILSCMRALSLTEILSVYSNGNWSNRLQPSPDIFLPQSEQYLPYSLSKALSASNQPSVQLDLLLGTNDLEIVNNDGFYEDLVQRGSSFILEYTNTKAIPELLRMVYPYRDEILPMLAHAVRWQYFEGRKYSNPGSEAMGTAEALARAESAVRWGVGSSLLAARLARRVGRLYVYRYSKQGFDLYGKRSNFSGAIRGSNVVALFGDPMVLQTARHPASPDDSREFSVFRKYISNFVRFGLPGEEWQRYKTGEAQINEIGGSRDVCTSYSSSKDVAFWLQYLPSLSKLLANTEHSEQLTSDKGIVRADESRLRGGVFAMCGVSVLLLVLLCACAFLLRKERAYRASPDDYHPS